jgi:hypothetical protein
LGSSPGRALLKIDNLPLGSTVFKLIDLSAYFMGLVAAAARAVCLLLNILLAEPWAMD